MLSRDSIVYVILFFNYFSFNQMDVQNLITRMRDGIIDLLNHGVDNESICLYINAMHDCIQDRLLSNNRIVDDMQFDDNDEIGIQFIPDCVLRKESQCFAM